jgi:hypothetical protein
MEKIADQDKNVNEIKQLPSKITYDMLYDAYVKMCKKLQDGGLKMVSIKPKDEYIESIEKNEINLINLYNIYKKAGYLDEIKQLPTITPDLVWKTYKETLAKYALNDPTRDKIVDAAADVAENIVNKLIINMISNIK